MKIQTDYSKPDRRWAVWSGIGLYIGVVFAPTEEQARLAALSTYEIGPDEDFSVTER